MCANRLKPTLSGREGPGARALLMGCALWLLASGSSAQETLSFEPDGLVTGKESQSLAILSSSGTLFSFVSNQPVTLELGGGVTATGLFPQSPKRALALISVPKEVIGAVECHLRVPDELGSGVDRSVSQALGILGPVTVQGLTINLDRVPTVTIDSAGAQNAGTITVSGVVKGSLQLEAPAGIVFADGVEPKVVSHSAALSLGGGTMNPSRTSYTVALVTGQSGATVVFSVESLRYDSSLFSASGGVEGELPLSLNFADLGVKIAVPNAVTPSGYQKVGQAPKPIAGAPSTTSGTAVTAGAKEQLFRTVNNGNALPELILKNDTLDATIAVAIDGKPDPNPVPPGAQAAFAVPNPGAHVILATLNNSQVLASSGWSDAYQREAAFNAGEDLEWAFTGAMGANPYLGVTGSVAPSQSDAAGNVAADRAELVWINASPTRSLNIFLDQAAQTPQLPANSRVSWVVMPGQRQITVQVTGAGLPDENSTSSTLFNAGSRWSYTTAPASQGATPAATQGSAETAPSTATGGTTSTTAPPPTTPRAITPRNLANASQQPAASGAAAAQPGTSSPARPFSAPAQTEASPSVVNVGPRAGPEVAVEPFPIDPRGNPPSGVFSAQGAGPGMAVDQEAAVKRRLEHSRPPYEITLFDEQGREVSVLSQNPADRDQPRRLRVRMRLNTTPTPAVDNFIIKLHVPGVTAPIEVRLKESGPESADFQSPQPILIPLPSLE